MTYQNTPLRSCLFVPGHRPERFDKALASGASAVIIDLEDAVAITEKTHARNAARAWLNTSRPVLLRINSPGTAWFDEDVQLCALPGVAGVVLPKAECAQDIASVRLHAPDTPIFPMIETALGFHHMLEIARMPGVQRLLFGSLDFQLDLGLGEHDDALLYFRSQLVLISRLAHLQAPIDGVSQAIDDTAQVDADTLYARQLGFGGKLCIHPRQVERVNRCFRPSASELAWAEKVVAAAEQVSGAAVAIDGKMVDRPVIMRAYEILREHQT